MQIINLLASARPNLGAAGQGRCAPAAGRGGGRAPTGVGDDNCEAPLLAGRGDDAQDGRVARRAAAVTEPRRTEPRRPGGSRPRSGGRRRRTGSVAGGEGVGRFREASGGRESRGAENEGCRGRRRSGRMTAAEEDEDTTTIMAAADRGQKSG
jgi:hypothetical protein